MAGISLNGLGPLFEIESHCSSLLNTYENWQFKMSAFLLLSDCVIPVLSFRGTIPVFSVRSPLIKPQNLLGFYVESGLIMFVMQLL